MSWIKCLNGNVIDVPEDQVESLVKQGHVSYDTEAAARKAKTPKAPGAEAPEANSEPVAN